MATTLSARRAVLVLLATSQKRSSKLANKVAGATTTPATTMRLLPTSEERARKLAHEVTRAAAAVPTVILLASTHERVHSETPETTCPVARWAVAHAACAIAGIRTLRAIWPVIGICGLCWCAAIRAAAHRDFAGGQIPLRHAGADLYVVVFP